MMDTAVPIFPFLVGKILSSRKEGVKLNQLVDYCDFNPASLFFASSISKKSGSASLQRSRNFFSIYIVFMKEKICASLYSNLSLSIGVGIINSHTYPIKRTPIIPTKFSRITTNFKYPFSIHL